MTTVSLFNQKGGVGKTTTAVNLAHELATNFNKRVLVVDLDPQANGTQYLGLLPRDVEAQDIKTIYSFFEAGLEAYTHPRYPEIFSQIIQHSDSFGVDYIPGSIILSRLERDLNMEMQREVRLKRILDPAKSHYDFVIIDCAPNLGLLNINALVASDYLMVPVDVSLFSFIGMQDLQQTVSDVIASELNKNLKYLGILLTQFDGRTTVAREALAALQENFNELVFNTTIPSGVAAKSSVNSGVPIVKYDKQSAVASAYHALAEEVLQRVK